MRTSFGYLRVVIESKGGHMERKYQAIAQFADTCYYGPDLIKVMKNAKKICLCNVAIGLSKMIILKLILIISQLRKVTYQ